MLYKHRACILVEKSELFCAVFADLFDDVQFVYCAVDYDVIYAIMFFAVFFPMQLICSEQLRRHGVGGIG